MKAREGAVLGHLGLAYRDLGEADQAINYHEQRLAIVREIGDRQGEGNALHNLSLVFADFGEGAQAITYAQDALTILEQIEAPNVAIVRQQLAD